MARGPSYGQVLPLVLIMGLQAAAYVRVDDIRAGDIGYGLVTLRGTEVTRYDVEVLEVLRGDGTTVDALLVRVGGSEMDRVGGIAAGMSGSPIYLRGELAAALAYAIPDADPRYGYATPAEYLVPLLEGNAPPTALALLGPSRREVAQPVRAPAALVPQGMAVSQAAPETSTNPPRVVPGSAVGLQLVRGNINVTTIGTVTELSGDRVLFLGHKYLHEGPCEYPLVAMRIGAVVPSERVPTLVGTPVGPPLGTVIEDRGAGCVAILGRTPRMAPLSIAVSSEGRPPHTLRMECVRTPELLRETAASALIAAADGLLDRVGPGSARLEARIYCAGGFGITRADVVSSFRDVGGQCAAELRGILDELYSNPLYDLPVEALEVSLTARDEPAPARIRACTVTPSAARPGSEVLVTVEVGPFRAGTTTVQRSIRVPDGFSGGVLLVRAHARAAQRVGVFDPWEQPPSFASPAAYCEWIGLSGRGSSIAVDLIWSPLAELLSPLAVVSRYDEGSELGTRDVPDREVPEAAGGLPGLLASGKVLAREIIDTEWSVSGDATATLEVSPR